MRWFKHDSDANRDAKLQKVVIKYGLEGYGLYWYCIELIAGNIDTHNLTFELEHDSELLSHHTNIHQERLEEMMEYFVRIGLFESANGVITCLKIAKRLDQSMTSNKDLRKKIAVVHQLLPNRGINNNHDSVMTQSCQSHDKVMQEEKRIEEIRRDKKKTSRFTPPSPEELRLYAKEKNLTITGFMDYYNSNGWMVGKNKMKCWKSAASGWSRRQSSFGNVKNEDSGYGRAI